MSSDSEYYDKRGKVVLLWRIRAAELREAARLVWQGGMIQLRAEDGTDHQHQELYRPAQLLMGLSLEVALKGLLVERNPTLFDGGKLANELKTHSLEILFQGVGIPLEDTEEELNFIRKLSDAVEWVAKYPVPLSAPQFRTPKHKSKQTMIRNDKDFARFEALWQRIDTEFVR